MCAMITLRVYQQYLLQYLVDILSIQGNMITEEQRTFLASQYRERTWKFHSLYVVFVDVIHNCG
jgi:hypothetical protein